MIKTTNKFSHGVRARAVWMVRDHEKDHSSRWATAVCESRVVGAPNRQIAQIR